MIDVNDPKSLKHLHACVEASWENNSKARKERDQLISDFTGSHYEDANAAEETKDQSVNFVELATSVYRRELVSDNPRVYSTSEFKDLQSYTETVTKTLNWRFLQMGLKNELERLATDALLGPMGIMKVGRDIYRTYEHEGQTMRLHRTYAKTVDFADFVYDTTARRYEEVAFAGNLVRMREDAFKASPIFTKDAKDTILANEPSRYRVDGTHGIKADEDAGGNAHQDTYEKYVEFWDLWLPRERKTLLLPKTMPADFDEALWSKSWKGPEIGPYYILGFGVVPGNILPMSPMTALRDLNDLLNDLFSKMEDQALRQKKNPVFHAGNEDDTLRLADADDGEAIRMEGEAKEVRTGGVDQINLVMFLEVKKLIEYVGGGLPILAGLGPMSETLGQDRLLAAASSKRMADMQGKMVACVRDICEGIGFYEWRDPRSDPPITKELPGGVIRKLSFAPEHRKGNFDQYSIQLHPYSLREQSPIERVSQLDQFVQTIVIPLLPEMPKHGMAFDFKEYVDLRSRLLDLPELKQVIMYVEPDERDFSQGRNEQRQSPVTERVNTRVNKSAGMNSDDATIAKLMSGGNQQAVGAA